MKSNIFFIILLLISTTACSNCKNVEGKYSTNGAGESIIYLNLISGNKFTLKHEAWQPGHFENRETINSKGSWSCSNNQLVLTGSNLTHKSEYIAIGENPLNINKSTMIIHFYPSNIKHYLNNEIFYPIASLTD